MILLFNIIQYPFVPTTTNFITQNEWDILTYLNDILYIFYVATVGLSNY